MKEDILEQLVDDYLQLNGYFTIHNVKFHPAENDPEYVRSQDCVSSDVDVVGFHPLRKGPDRIWVVSCKSWQSGFNPAQTIRSIQNSKKKSWKRFRELAKRKWAAALIREIQKRTRSSSFTYITAVTKLRGDRKAWQELPLFKKNLRGNPLKIVTLREILDDIYKKTSTTVASSEVGRLLQVIKASGWKP